MSLEEPAQRSRLRHGRLSLTALALLALGLIVGIPAAGVIGAFVIAIAISVSARKQ